MSDIPDSSLWRLIEIVGPWVRDAASAMALVIAWMWRGMLRRMEKMESEITLRPTRTELGEAVERVSDDMKSHIDTVRTDVRTLHQDVRDVLKMMVNNK